MRRRIIHTLAVVSWLLGMVGWIAIPDDISAWSKLIKSFAMPLGSETIIIILFGIASTAFLYNVAETTISGLVRKNLAKRAPIRIVYSNECNKPHIQSLFKRSISFLPNGELIKHKITLNTFYIGVKNKSKIILKNCKLNIHEKNIPNEILDIKCIAENTKTSSIDILPGAMEYFLLGQCYDTSDSGMFSPVILNSENIDKIAKEVSGKKMIDLSLIGSNNTAVLLKNNGYVLGFSVYADNTPTAHGEIEVNAKGNIEVLVKQKSQVDGAR